MAQRNRGNPWGQGSQGGGKQPKSSKKNTHGPPPPVKSAEERFRQAQAKLQESVKKHLDQELELSSEEEDLETENIYDSVIKNYSQIGGKNEDLGKTQNFLENIFRSDVAICLICIATIKRADKIWSCGSCYGVFHLLCIQRWGKDSIAHQKLAEDERISPTKKEYHWPCPKCRKNYTPDSIPQRYECFCHQVIDPPFQPWLVPHSCGQVCGKDLVPSCGHSCLLLCHPGPCPPCPKMIRSKCYCSNGGEKMVRCCYKEWSCGQKCSKKLACQKHKCETVCHPGECPACPKTSMIFCDCQNQSRMTACAELFWKCEKVCRKTLDCSKHNCELVCHKGDCGPCPRALPRACPCGAEENILPCTQEVPTCGSTCGKLLDCGLHTCNQRCHRGSCGDCMEFLEKYCRCGLHKKEIACIKEYLCDTKCKGIRHCGIHPCNRKCCDGRCPPCEKICGKTLRCGQHKCASVCHRGSCYPCEQTKQLSCRCGSTVITVPCGTHKKKKNLKCNKLCLIPPDCSHEKREEHKCHMGPCPPCRQVCHKPRDCGHPCSLNCHSSVVVSAVPNYKPATPWDRVTAPTEVKELPCPPCEVPVGVWCPGKHEMISLPCHRAISQQCGRTCGRTLACTNHECGLPCHEVIGAPDDESAGVDCMECGEDCEAPRPCSHPCPQSCHPPPCPDCAVTVKLRCHCGINFTYVKCHEWTLEMEEETRRALQSCQNQCPKTHPGEGGVTVENNPEQSGTYDCQELELQQAGIGGTADLPGPILGPLRPNAEHPEEAVTSLNQHSAGATTAQQCSVPNPAVDQTNTHSGNGAGGRTESLTQKVSWAGPSLVHDSVQKDSEDSRSTPLSKMAVGIDGANGPMVKSTLEKLSGAQRRKVKREMVLLEGKVWKRYRRKRETKVNLPDPQRLDDKVLGVESSRQSSDSPCNGKIGRDLLKNCRASVCEVSKGGNDEEEGNSATTKCPTFVGALIPVFDQNHAEREISDEDELAVRVVEASETMVKATVKKKQLSGAQRRRVNREMALLEGRVWKRTKRKSKVNQPGPQRMDEKALGKQSTCQGPIIPFQGDGKVSTDKTRGFPVNYGASGSGISKFGNGESGNTPTTKCPASEKARIAVFDQNHPDREITDDESLNIQWQLFARFPKGYAVRFFGVFQRCGVLVIQCADRISAEWLTVTVPQITPWEGANLIARPWSELRRMAKVMFRVPELLASVSSAEILRKIEFQNHSVHTRHWRVLNSNVPQRGRTIVANIPEHSLQVLRGMNMNIYLGFGSITIRVIRLPRDSAREQSTGGKDGFGHFA